MSYKIIDRFYINEEPGRATEETGLSLLEIQEVVGVFEKHSHRAGMLRGEVIKWYDGTVKIRHHFTRKVFCFTRCR